MMLQEHLNRLNLPSMLFDNVQTIINPKDWKTRRNEIKDILSKNIYGKMPSPPQKVIGKQLDINLNAFAGKAIQQKIMLSFQTPNGIFEFPVILIKPKKADKHPLILHIAFFPADISNNYYPAEEIIDNGFAAASFCYKDITSDNDDLSDGLAGMYRGSGKNTVFDRNVLDRDPDDCGKIAMWAWAASRVMDYLQELVDNEIDKDNIAVMGHSRLGKTALLAGAIDERFTFTISNDSGCSGAAITRNKTGEHVKDICKNFGYWFCENYKKYIDNEAEMPFDQHFLLAFIAPRFLYVASAIEDTWADPFSEYLSCVESDKIYKLLDNPGFIHPDRFPVAEENFTEGNIGYHLRNGTHFLSRYDWQKFMDFIKKHRI